MANYVRKEPCIKCRANGNDTKGDNRVIYDDGSYYCFACGDFKTSGFTLSDEIKLEILPTEVVETVLKKRGATKETIKTYGVKAVVDDEGAVKLSFPFTDINGVESNYQYRGVDLSTGNLTKDITYSKGKVRIPLLGWRLVKPTTETVIICEGLTDCLALASVVKQSNTVVVGMTSATAAVRAASHVLTANDKLKIVLAFDNDDAGREAVQFFVDTVENHSEGRVINRLVIPQEYNDVCDWLAADVDHTLEFKHITGGGVIGSEDIAAKVGSYLTTATTKKQIELSFSPTLSDALRLMPGKLVGIIGSSGEGKSTVAEHFAMEALQQKLNVFVVSQEMLPEEFAIKLLRMVRNQPLDSPKFISTLSKEDINDIVKQTETLCRTLGMTDSFGAMSIDNIDKAILRLTAAGRHPDLVIIDHLLAISSDTEVATILDVCKKLKGLARAHNTCVVILTHTNKQPHSKGIIQPRLNSAYGSSGIPIYCDSALGIASDKRACITMVETVKFERMGGKYANVSLSYSDYCLSEQVTGDKTTYSEDEDDVETEIY